MTSTGSEKTNAKQARSASAVSGAGPARAQFEALSADMMPNDYSVSLDAYRRGGTDMFLAKPPEGLVSQPMRGFETTYINIVDYIVRITHRIWEEKDIGYIYDTYSHDCKVWDDFGLQYAATRSLPTRSTPTMRFPISGLLPTR